MSAKTLGDPDAELGEDILVCGDRKADKARVARIIELIPGLRAVNAGALETARIVEQLTSLLISVNVRYKTHAGLRITGLRRRRPLGLGESSVRVALLAGGTGGAKLAAGMQELVGADLAVIANTADDTRIHGLYVSPDPDLITYWLAGAIDEERGWGIREDSFVVHERLEQLGAPGWFQLSDRDLAACLYRTHFMDEGGTLTAAQGQIARALGVSSRVLPMSEEPVYTRVMTPGGWRGLQEFLIVDGSEPEIEGVEVQGLHEARPTPEVLEALAAAEAIVVGPSNPVISIGPILAVPGMREAIADVGRSRPRGEPVRRRPRRQGTDREVHGRARAGLSTAAGVASLYEGVIQAMVVDADDPDEGPEDVQVFAVPDADGGTRGAAGGRRASARVRGDAGVSAARRRDR